MAVSDHDKERAVDRWLEDVSAASRCWKAAKAAQESSESIVAYLEEVKSHVGVDGDLGRRMDEAIAKNRENAERLAVAAERLSELERGFYGVMEAIRPAEVAEAWRMHYVEGKTWSKCAKLLHYNRQHLNRLSRRAKAVVYDKIPRSYR